MTTDSQQASFVERMGGALCSAGLARLPARIFAAVLIDDDGRMTAAELADALRVSPASVSGAVRYLDGVGMVRREREPGSRRDIFVVDEDSWSGMLGQVDQIYGPMIAALDRALRDLPAKHPATRRLRTSREFMAFVLEEMKSLDQRWEVRRKELGL